MGIQVWRVASNEMFWEYNYVELLQREYFDNTIPQNRLKGNVLRMQFCRIASKRKCCENTIPQSCLKESVEYNSAELPQMKCFENTILQNCFKGNILRIQFRRIASKEMFWEYNCIEFPRRESIVRIQIHRVS